MFTVSQSRIKAWRECRKKYDYRYNQNLERRRKRLAPTWGTIVHSMIENLLNGLDPFKALKEAEKKFGKMFKEERDEYGDIIGDIRRLMTAYLEWYKRDPIIPISIEGRLAEHEFEVNLTPKILLKGKIDQLGKSRDKRKWLVEHKNHKQLPEGNIAYSDIQSMIYCWVMSKVFNIVPDGVMWNYLRRKAPAIPEQLKTGELTRRNIDTLWPVYLAEIKRLKLDPRDYKDMKDQLEGREATFFVRRPLPVKPVILKTVLEEAITTAEEMAKGLPIVRTIGRHCEWCDFYPLCQAELMGLDANYIRKADYKEREDEVEAQQTEQE